MKRVYIKPDIEVVDVEVESLLDTVSSETWDGGIVGDGQVGNETPDLSKYHNSVWDEWE